MTPSNPVPVGDEREEILHLWDTHVGDPTSLRPLVDADKLNFARAILARFGTRPAAEEGDYERDVRKALAAKDKWTEFIPELRGGVSAENAIEILGFMIAGEKEPRQSGSAGEADEDIQRARKLLARLCDHGLVSMSIPVDHARDEDMLLSRIIERAALSTPPTPEAERDRLRAEQATSVMPLIGPLLDAWEGIDNDTKGTIKEEAPDLARCLDAINRAMEGTPEAEPVQQDTVTLRERIAELASQHGSMRAAARVMECNAGYLSRLCSGEKVDPGPTLLRRMGLREIVRYERIVTPPAEKQAAPSGEDKTS